ncbi:hypothetical protein KI387_022307, partial [Taxus chinensis]
PICRTVTDAVYLLDEIVGYDVRDHRATKNAARFIPKGGYKQFLRTDGLRGKRLGIVRDPNLSPGSHGAISFEKHLATMRQKGATLVENHIFSNFLNISTVAEEIVLAYEFKRDLNIYLSELLQSPVHTLADIISFNTQHAMEISSVLAIAGYPGISVPAGYDTAGVPFGINFGGGRGSEPTLIEISYAFEQATKVRK